MLDMFDTDQLNLASVSTYQNYPASKPFINTEWTRQNHMNLSKAFPESNRDEIINSLKKLQEKLFQIENNQKSDNLQSNFKINNNVNNYANNTDNIYAAYPINNGYSNSFLYDDNNNKLIYSTNNSINEPYLKHISSIDEKAVSTERRVLELEKQLEKMRKLIRDDSDTTNNKSKVNTTKKKRQIESAILESDTTLQDVDQEFFTDDSSSAQLKNKPTRSKKKQFNTRKQDSFDSVLNVKKSCNLNRRKSADDHPILTQAKSHQHFKLNLGDIPFVVGKSTTPSHHLGTNIQNVFSLLKQHHPRLCGKSKNNCKSTESNSINTAKQSVKQQCRRSRCSVAIDNQIDEKKLKRSKSTPLASIVNSLEKSVEFNYFNEKKKVDKRETITVKATVKPEQSSEKKEDSLMHNVDWNELLRILQEEYTKLVLHHYDLTKKIINCMDDNKRSEYELKAEYLHRKMKTKAKQINKLKAIQQYKTSKKSSVEFQKQNNELLFTNSVKYGNQLLNNSNSVSLSHSLDKQQINPKTLKLFKDIKKFQHKFQND